MEQSILLIAGFGAFVQEFFHWYDLRKKLHLKEYQKLLKSKSYWIIVILTIIISALGVYILYKEKIADSPDLQMILGAAFPLLFKKLVSGVSTTEQQLGDTKTFKNYFK